MHLQGELKIVYDKEKKKKHAYILDSFMWFKKKKKSIYNFQKKVSNLVVKIKDIQYFLYTS